MCTYLAWFLALSALKAVAAQSYINPEYQIHPIFRSSEKFENLAVRQNGQILLTTTRPNASVYQVDPMGILPTVILHTIENVTGAAGIAEQEPGVFYFASGYISITSSTTVVPSEYSITRLDLRGVDVRPDGTLTKEVAIKHVASLPGAALLNGVAFARENKSDQLLVADSYRGLIWNVNVKTGHVDVSLNDTTTKGPAATGPGVTGVNGLKVYNKTMYWTNTGLASLFKIEIDEDGSPCKGATPILIASKIVGGVDDFLVDREDTAYVCGPYNVITKITPDGQQQIVAGQFNSSTSTLGGPTAVKFGKLVDDMYSMYVTTNGGILTNVNGSEGLSRIDLGFN